MRVTTMSDAARGSMTSEQCDVLLVPHVQHLGLLNWRAYDEAIKCAYDCALAHTGEIEKLMAKSSPAALSIM